MIKGKLIADVPEGSWEEWQAMSQNQLQCFNFNGRTFDILFGARGLSDLVGNQSLFLLIITRMRSILKCNI